MGPNFPQHPQEKMGKPLSLVELKKSNYIFFRDKDQILHCWGWSPQEDGTDICLDIQTDGRIEILPSNLQGIIPFGSSVQKEGLVRHNVQSFH